MSDILSEDMLFSGNIPSEREKLEQASKQIDQLASQGLVMDVDPDVADFMASFDEDALSSEDAEESIYSVDLNTGIVLSLEGEAA